MSSYAGRNAAEALRAIDEELAAEVEAVELKGRRCYGGDWSEGLERHGPTPMSRELDRLLDEIRRCC